MRDGALVPKTGPCELGKWQAVRKPLQERPVVRAISSLVAVAVLFSCGESPRRPQIWSLETRNLRLVMPLLPEQRAGIVARVRIAGEWQPLTSNTYGDWTYPGASVSSQPTRVELVKQNELETVMQWTFADHVIGAAYSPTGKELPYPFTKTVWVREGERGYYAQIVPLERFTGFSEHEIGFGGLWGPATVTTPEGTVRTDESSEHFRTEAPVGWGSLHRDSEQFTRHMILLSPEFARSPHFSDEVFGSLHRHGVTSEPYAVYLYGGRRSIEEVCQLVRRTAPRRLGDAVC